MHLSLWTIDSRELIDDWCTVGFTKIPIEVICSWQNLHNLASEQGHQISQIKGQEIFVFCCECNTRMFLVLIASCDDDKHCLGGTILKMANHIITMMADIDQCTVVRDYSVAVAACGWAITSLLTTASRPVALLPWALLSETPQIVLVHLSPLMKTCLQESLPTPMACLISRDRQLASSPSWDALPPIEKICLTLFANSDAPISDCIIRLISQPEKPLYRLIQIQLVPHVSLLMLCGSESSLEDIRMKVTKYWGTLLLELKSFQPRVLHYASLNSVPDSLCSFFQVSSLDNQCINGHMRIDISQSLIIDQSMKRIFLGSRSTSVALPVTSTVIVDREKDITFVISYHEGGSKTLILAFNGRIDGSEARTMASDVFERIETWLKTNQENELFT